jgi:hypothetical protein
VAIRWDLCEYELQEDRIGDPADYDFICEKCGHPSEFIRFMDAQLICLSGHQINDAYFTNHRKNRKNCPKCGEKTIFKCPSCEREIPGNTLPNGIYKYAPEVIPLDNYCECDEPYPWAPKKLKLGTTIASPFHGLKDLKWDEVQISFDSNTKVKIKVRKEKPRIFGFTELGFKNDRTGGADTAWIVFKCTFARDNGVFDFDSHPISNTKSKDNFKQYLSTIRKNLKLFFDIKDDPFSKYTRSKPWKTKFIISDSTVDLPGNKIDLEKGYFEPEYFKD